MRHDKFRWKPAIRAALLAIVLGLVVSRVPWSPASPGRVSTAFNQSAYRAGDTIRFVIVNRKVLPPHTKWSLDQQCKNLHRRSPVEPNVLRVVLVRQGNVFSLTPDQRRLLHLPRSEVRRKVELT